MHACKLNTTRRIVRPNHESLLRTRMMFMRRVCGDAQIKIREVSKTFLQFQSHFCFAAFLFKIKSICLAWLKRGPLPPAAYSSYGTFPRIHRLHVDTLLPKLSRLTASNDRKDRRCEPKLHCTSSFTFPLWAGEKKLERAKAHSVNLLQSLPDRKKVAKSRHNGVACCLYRLYLTS